MKRKLVLLALFTFVVIVASAMILRLNYVKVEDKNCNRCVISNADEGLTRACGKCGGYIKGGQAETKSGNWLQATFTCNKCGHQSIWKYKLK